jgi:hypothetical protein
MILKQLSGAAVRALFILIIAFALRSAEHAGLLGEDGARRVFQILIGLGLAIYANGMPKRIGNKMPATQTQIRLFARSQAALRVGGWSMTLAGLVYAGLWAFGPLDVANTWSMWVIVSATVITFVYAVWAYASCRNANNA